MPIPEGDLEALAPFAEIRYAMVDILAAAEVDQLIPAPPLPDDLTRCRSATRRWTACSPVAR